MEKLKEFLRYIAFIEGFNIYFLQESQERHPEPIDIFGMCVRKDFDINQYLVWEKELIGEERIKFGRLALDSLPFEYLGLQLKYPGDFLTSYVDCKTKRQYHFVKIGSRLWNANCLRCFEPSTFCTETGTGYELLVKCLFSVTEEQNVKDSIVLPVDNQQELDMCVEDALRVFNVETKYRILDCNTQYEERATVIRKLQKI